MVRQGIADPLLAQQATVADLPGIRFWGDEVPADIKEAVRTRLPNLPKLATTTQGGDGRSHIDILALSGGGGDGAFGAGFLKGWTQSGTRPQFEVVTGVSAGAIIAPFAFLGPQYDIVLEEIWTQYQTSQLVTAQILPGLLGGSALADTAPLASLIAKYVDRKLLREIAKVYRKDGRILLVGTTNLDAQRPVVWNMGEIASIGTPAALELFRKVIMASAAIPGAFPPVSIPVTVDGQPYTELHVDGGTTREIFVAPVQVPLHAFNVLYDKPPSRKLYIISNMKTSPEQKVVQPNTISIAARAISTLIKSQSQGEIYRIYRMARDAKADFHFVSVPASFSMQAKEFFDPAYQRALFDAGEALGATGTAWSKVPPEEGRPSGG
ncbi:MAG: patatin-like phospholipase family protein [Hyphomicrobiaceae bacterium]|nr:patatin-like phospholipase family protein [Hyphomicrobiaceae bacterium]